MVLSRLYPSIFLDTFKRSVFRAIEAFSPSPQLLTDLMTRMAMDVYGAMIMRVKARMDAGEDVPNCLAKTVLRSLSSSPFRP
jgi:hypothetical protein